MRTVKPAPPPLREPKRVEDLPERARDILELCCARGFATPEEVLSKRQDARVVAVRRCYVRALRAEGLAWNAVGELSNRDHTTVMYLLGMRKARQRELA